MGHMARDEGVVGLRGVGEGGGGDFSLFNFFFFFVLYYFLFLFFMGPRWIRVFDMGAVNKLTLDHGF